MSKSKIYAKIPNYVKNVSKSVAYSANDIIKSVIPSTSDFVSTNSDVFKAVVTDVRNLRTTVKTVGKNISQTEHMKSISKIKKNALEDLKSGDFYNQGRKDRQASEMFGSDDFGDFGFDDSGLDTFSSDTAKKVTTSRPNVVVNNNGAKMDALAMLSGKVANATVNSADYIVQNQTALNNMNLVTNYKMFGEMSHRLSEANGYLKGMFDYTNNMTAFFKQSVDYFNDAKTNSDKLFALNKETKEMLQNVYKGLAKKEQASPYQRNPIEDILSTGGGLDIGEYSKFVKKNAKNAWEGSLVGSMMNMANAMSGGEGGMFDEIAAAPLAFIAAFAGKKMIPKNAKKSLASMDKTFSQFFKSAIYKFGSKANESNSPVAGIIKDILGIDFQVNKTVKTGTYEKGPIQFDGMTKHAVVEVIPTYLRKILAAVTSSKEMIYNYDSGKFMTGGEVRKTIKDEDNSSYFGMNSAKYKLKDILKGVSMDNMSKDIVNDDLDTFLKFLVDKAHFYNPKKDKYDKLMEKGLSLTGGDDSYKVLKAAFGALDKEDLMEFADNQISTSDYRKRAIEQRTKDLTLKGYSGRYNNAGFDDYTGKGVISQHANINNPYGVSLDKFVDKYNYNMLDYLRDIKNVLYRGIVTYGSDRPIRPVLRTNTPRYNKPNTSAEDNAVDRQPRQQAASDSRILPSDDDSEEALRRNAQRSRGAYLGNIFTSDMSEDELVKNMKRSYLHRNNIDASNANFFRTDSNDNDLNKFLADTGNDLINSSPNTRRLVSVFKQGQSELLSVPAKFITKLADNVNNSMFEMLYGKDVKDKEDGEGWFEFAKRKLTSKLDSYSELVMDKVITPLQNWLFGEHGLITKLNTMLMPKLKNLFNNGMNFMFGQKQDEGGRKGGFLSKLYNQACDVGLHIRRGFTGKGFRSRANGQTLNDLDDSKSIFGQIKGIGLNIKDMFKKTLFGDGENKIGVVGHIKSWMGDLTGHMNSMLFGKSANMSVSQLFNSEIRPALPKMGAGALLGGLLGGLIGPFGLVGSALVGSTLGLVKSSSMLKDKLFGKIGDDGNRVGSKFISAKAINFMKKAYPSGAKGGLFGLMAGLLPISPFGMFGGMILGSSIGFLKESDKVKDFLFGKMGKDGKRDQMSALIKKAHLDKFKKLFPAMGKGALAGFTLNGSLGLLTSFALPGGPIGGALVGLTAGILSQNEKVKTYLFGQYNPDKDKREGGLFGKLKLWLDSEVIQPLKLSVKNLKSKGMFFLRKHIVNPIADAIEPLKVQMKLVGGIIKNKVLDGFSSLKTKIGDIFEKQVGLPFGKFMNQHFLDPLKKFTSKIFGGLGKIFGGIISAPFKAVNKAAMGFLSDHEKLGVADYMDTWKKQKKHRDRRTNLLFEREQKNIFRNKNKLDYIRNLFRTGDYDIHNKFTGMGIDFMSKFKQGKKFDMSMKFPKVDYQAKNLTNNTKIVKNTSGIFDTVKGMFHYIAGKFGDGKDKVKKYMSDKVHGMTDYIKEKRAKKQRQNRVDRFFANHSGMGIGLGFAGGDNTDGIFKTGNFSGKSFMVSPNMFTNGNRVSAGLFNNHGGNKNTAPNPKAKHYSQQFNGNYGTTDDYEPNPKPKKYKSNAIHGDINIPSTLFTMKTHLDSIDKELRGQLDGVGYNLEYIKNILVDKFGSPSILPGRLRGLRGNFKRKGIFGRLFNFLSKPMNFMKDLIGLPFKMVGDTMKATASAIGQAGSALVGTLGKVGVGLLKLPVEILKFGSELLKTVQPMVKAGFQLIGGIIKTGATALNESLKATGKFIGGMAKGIGQTIGHFLDFTGHSLKVAGKAAINGLYELGRGLYSATKAVAQFAVGIAKFIGKNLIMKPAKYIYNKVSGNGQTKSSKMGAKGTMKITGGIIDLVKEVKNIISIDNVDRVKSIDTIRKLEDNSLYSRLDDIIAIIKPRNNNSSELVDDVKAIGSRAYNNIRTMSGFKSGSFRLTPMPGEVPVTEPQKPKKDSTYMKQQSEKTKEKEEKRKDRKNQSNTAVATQGTFDIMKRNFGHRGLFSKIATAFVMGLPLLKTVFKKLKNFLLNPMELFKGLLNGGGLDKTIEKKILEKTLGKEGGLSTIIPGLGGKGKGKGAKVGGALETEAKGLAGGMPILMPGKGSSARLRRVEPKVGKLGKFGKILGKVKGHGKGALALAGIATAISMIDSRREAQYDSEGNEIESGRTGFDKAFDNPLVGMAGDVASTSLKQTALKKGATGFAGMIEKIINSPAGKKVFSKLGGGAAKSVVDFVVKQITRLAPNMVAKITTRLAVTTGTMGASAVVSAGIVPAIVYGVQAGAGALAAKKYFKLPAGVKPTGKMLIAAAVTEFITMNLTFGFIPEDMIAGFIYRMIAGKEEEQALATQQQQFKMQYEQYKQNGGTQSFDQYNESQNATVIDKAKEKISTTAKGAFQTAKDWGGKAWNGIKWAGGKIGEGVKGAWNGIKWAGGKIAEGAQGAWNGAKWLGGKALEGAKSLGNYAMNNTVLAGMNDSKVRKDLGLNDDVKLTLGDRAAEFGGQFLHKASFGLLNQENTTKAINGIEVKVRDGVDAIHKNIDQGLSNLDTKVGTSLGFVDKDGKPMKLSTGIAQKTSEFTKACSDKWSSFRKGADDFLSKTSSEAGKKWDSIKSNIGSGLQSMDKGIGGMLGFVDDSGNATSFTQGVASGMKTIGQNVASSWKSFSDNVKSCADWIGQKVGKKLEEAKEATKGALDWASEKVSSTASSVGGWFKDAWNTVTSPFVNASNADAQKRNQGGEGLGDDGKYPSIRETRGGFGSAETKNGMVYFSQYDDPWKSMPYGPPSGKTILTSGCGPTSAAMVLSTMTGKYITPEMTAKWSQQHGFRDPNAGTSWGFFNAIGRDYGVNITETGDKGSIKAALEQHKPVILSGQGTRPFTSCGHFVVGVGASNGKVLINDPINRSRSTTYDLNGVMGQVAQGFIVDKQLPGNVNVEGGATAGVPGAPGTAPVPKQGNTFMDAMSELGKLSSGFLDAAVSGKAFDPTALLTPEGQNPASQSTGSTSHGQISPNLAKYAALFNEAGAKYGVDPGVLSAIAMQESGGNPNDSNGYALGLMQIENSLDSEFAAFGRKTAGQSWTLADRADPAKAIPFAASRLSTDLKHYNGDYAKAIQAYNFSHYSLDMLLKRYPNDWRAHTAEMGAINGQGGSYGDSKYLQHVMRYYQGDKSKVVGGFGLPTPIGQLKGGFGLAPNEKIDNLTPPTPTIDYNRFISNNYTSSINKMSDYFTELDKLNRANSTSVVGDGGISDAKIASLEKKFDMMIQLLATIAGNTTNINESVSDISKTQTHANTSQQSNNKKEEPTETTPQDINPFSSMRFGGSNNFVSGYEKAKLISQGIKKL